MFLCQFRNVRVQTMPIAIAFAQGAPLHSLHAHFTKDPYHQKTQNPLNLSPIVANCFQPFVRRHCRHKNGNHALSYCYVNHFYVTIIVNWLHICFHRHDCDRYLPGDSSHLQPAHPLPFQTSPAFTTWSRKSWLQIKPSTASTSKTKQNKTKSERRKHADLIGHPIVFPDPQTISSAKLGRTSLPFRCQDTLPTRQVCGCFCFLFCSWVWRA